MTERPEVEVVAYKHWWQRRVRWLWRCACGESRSGFASAGHAGADLALHSARHT